MRIFVYFVLLLCAAPAAAQNFEACTKPERTRIETAIAGATDMTARAAAAVVDDVAYATWFGQYTRPDADDLRARLKAVHHAMSHQTIDIVCVNDGFEGCDEETYAFVYIDEPYRIYVCDPFHRLPALHELPSDAIGMENGTREGTILHEMSHFLVVGGSEDTCYARSVCRQLASTDTVGALRTADSLQYYAEDVVLRLLDPAAKTGRSRHMR